MWASLRLGAILLAVISRPASSQAIQFNNPEGVDIWCGKAYRATNASFNPGGWFQDPPLSSAPLLRLHAKPRWSYYLASETAGSLLIDADVSYQVGQPLPAAYVPSANTATNLTVTVSLGNATLATASVAVGSRDNEVAVDLSSFSPSVAGYNLSVTAALGANTTYTYTYAASAELLRLPEPEGYGSVARLDNLHGGLWARRGAQDWAVIFPYTYYVQWSLYWDFNLTTLSDFAAKGYNVIHIVPTGTLSDTPFPWDQFLPYLDRADELGLYLQYDVLWTWGNLTGMVDQVSVLRTHPALLLWYQSDEPDGKGNPPNSTGIAYDIIKQLDPYHPVSLALNCYDFYYADYAAGADIITPDVYPVSTNTSWSTVYETACNATYGCCGCDDCHGSFSDISARLDEFRRRDGLLGWQKTQWFAPQAFGNETFWTRYPTAAEEVVMSVLAVNHGAKGLVMWDYPTSDEILKVTERLAGVMTGDVLSGFVLGAEWTAGLHVTTAAAAGGEVDAAAWVDGDKGEVLLSVVNLGYGDVNGTVEVALPEGVSLAAGQSPTVLWGDVELEVGEKSVVATGGLLGLEVAMMLLTLA